MINKTFTIQNKKIKKETTLAVLSDLHFNRYLPQKLLMESLQNLKEHHPDFIIIPGDIVDSTNELEYSCVVDNLRSFISKLTKIAPVIACFGNHDI